MKQVLILIAPGFEEIEAVTVIDILRRAGARVTIAATVTGLIKGSRELKIQPDAILKDIKQEIFDMLVLPGGIQGTKNLQEDPQVLALVKSMNNQKKIIGAICAAPVILNKAGILKGHSVTSHPSVKDKLIDVSYSEGRVIKDGNIITSRSPGTAMEFAMKLIEILFDFKRVEVVNRGVMARL